MPRRRTVDEDDESDLEEMPDATEVAPKKRKVIMDDDDSDDEPLVNKGTTTAHTNKTSTTSAVIVEPGTNVDDSVEAEVVGSQQAIDVGEYMIPPSEATNSSGEQLRYIVMDIVDNSFHGYSFPFGKICAGKYTADGDIIWRHSSPNDDAHYFIFGSFEPDASGNIIFFRCPESDVSDYASLTRPSSSTVIDNIIAKDNYIRDCEASIKDKEHRASEAERLHSNYKKQKQNEKKRLVEAHLAEMKDLTLTKTNVEAERDDLKKRMQTLIDQQSSTTPSVLPLAKAHLGKSLPVIDAETIYKAFIDGIIDAYHRWADTWGGKWPISPSGSSSTTTASKYYCVFEWLNDQQVWTVSTDSAFTDVYTKLYESANDTAKYQYMNFPYEAVRTRARQFNIATTPTLKPGRVTGSFSPAEDQASVVAEFTQHNTSTGKKRNVRMRVTSTDPTQTSGSSARSNRTVVDNGGNAKPDGRIQAEGEVLAGHKFLCSTASFPAAVWLKSCPELITCLPTARDSYHNLLNDSILKLAEMFSDFSQRSFKFDRSKTRALIKPQQLHKIMTMISIGKVKHYRLCAHASNNNNFDKIANDYIGLDVAYTKSSCKYGKGNYVAFTYETGERGGFNATNTHGKTMLMLLFSPVDDIELEPRPYTSYNFYCNQRDKRGRVMADAVSVHGNDFLLPLAIVSP